MLIIQKHSFDISSRLKIKKINKQIKPNFKKSKLKISYRANFLKQGILQFEFFLSSFFAVCFGVTKSVLKDKKKKSKSTKPINILLEKLNTLLQRCPLQTTLNNT